jgi:hypothetical protein
MPSSTIRTSGAQAPPTPFFHHLSYPIGARLRPVVRWAFLLSPSVRSDYRLLDHLQCPSTFFLATKTPILHSHTGNSVFRSFIAGFGQLPQICIFAHPIVLFILCGMDLLVEHSGCDRYNRLSLRRALAILKRPWTVTRTAWGCVFHAVMLRVPSLWWAVAGPSLAWTLRQTQFSQS